MVTTPPVDCVQDVLTRLHSMLGPHYNYVFTGDELCAAILEPAIQLFNLPSSSVRTYVLCADEPSRVPVEKAAEQKRRLEPDRATRRHAATNPEAAAATDAKRRRPASLTSPAYSSKSTWKERQKQDLERVYPPDACVVAAGIRYRPQMADGTRGDEVIEESLYLPSLLRERRARTTIWTYLMQYLAASVSTLRAAAVSQDACTEPTGYDAGRAHRGSSSGWTASLCRRCA